LNFPHGLQRTCDLIRLDAAAGECRGGLGELLVNFEFLTRDQTVRRIDVEDF